MTDRSCSRTPVAMAEDKPPPKPAPPPPKDEREKRLAEALRANLRRRKQAERE